MNVINNKDRFAYLYGYWLGDGCRTTQSLTFAIEEKNVSFLKAKIDKILSTKTIIKKLSQGCYRFNNGFKLQQIFQKMNYDDIKEYPWHFIAGLLDSDGSIDLPFQKENKNIIKFCFFNTNLELLQFLKTLFDKNNIPCKLFNSYIDKGKTKTIKGKLCNIKPSWRLIVYSRAACYILCKKLENISFKNKRMTTYINYYKKKNLYKVIPIEEIFFSLQGEGTAIGQPQIFIRCFGCNLFCPTCDTKYTWQRKKLNSRSNILIKKGITIKEIVDSIQKYDCKNICLTGGEFLLYSSKLRALIAFLKEKDYTIILQTNGTLYDKTVFNTVDKIAMDIKTPCTKVNSNESLIKFLREGDEIKTLINNEEDYKYALHINQLTRRTPCTQILQIFNNVGDDTPNNLISKLKWLTEKVIKDSEQWENIRVLPQLHVLIYGNKKGV